ncbi:hypothetical protein JB92DRAFT_3038134 [Gautieria morchelliformis]|nr:hypothetical protein JB92DRAFT_3038134 [Gautieria morchelliformis]
MNGTWQWSFEFIRSSQVWLSLPVLWLPSIMTACGDGPRPHRDKADMNFIGASRYKACSRVTCLSRARLDPSLKNSHVACPRASCLSVVAM